MSTRTRTYWTLETYSVTHGWQLDPFRSYGLLAFASRQQARDYCARKLAESETRMRPVRATFTVCT
jgi:hypothetical protein